MMNPTIWGPHMWFVLHSMTLGYPNQPTDQDKTTIKNFFINLQNNLPCQSCQENYKKHLAKHPLTDNILNSQKQLVNWLIAVHNSVNVMTGKRTYSYDEVMKKYNQAYNKKPNNNRTYIILLIIVILALLYILFKKIEE